MKVTFSLRYLHCTIKGRRVGNAKYGARHFGVRRKANFGAIWRQRGCRGINAWVSCVESVSFKIGCICDGWSREYFHQTKIEGSLFGCCVWYDSIACVGHCWTGGYFSIVHTTFEKWIFMFWLLCLRTETFMVAFRIAYLRFCKVVFKNFLSLYFVNSRKASYTRLSFRIVLGANC